MSDENYGKWLDTRIKEVANRVVDSAQRVAQHEKQAKECRDQIISFRGSLAALNEAKKQFLSELPVVPKYLE